MANRKPKSLDIGSVVSVPDRIIFPGRRDPYEWENGIVLDHGSNKDGKNIVKVRVRRYNTKRVYEKWFFANCLEKATFHHAMGEKEEFASWVIENGAV